MKVSAERIPEGQVVLQIEVEPERLEGALDSAYRRLVKKTQVPGFRPGKAPRAMLERYLGEHALLHDAIDRLLPQVYQEAVEEQQLDPIDFPEVEIVTEQPLVLKATVPLRPTVDLGDYQALRVPRDPVAVDPERVQEQLERLGQRYATLEPVQRPLQWGDIVRADVFGAVGQTTLVDEKDVEFRLREGEVISLPGFAERLIGAEEGAELSFELPVPPDSGDPRLAGESCSYRLVIHGVKEEKLPELDDDFARQVGEGFPTLVALRERIASDLQRIEEEVGERRYHDQIISALLARAELDYPPVLVEREVDRLLQEQAGPAQQGRDLERYLQRVGKSEEELRAELRPPAEERVRRSLVLSQVAEAENITVGDAEVEAEVERLVAGAGEQADEARRLFASEQGRDALRRSLLTRKTLERLVDIASAGEAEGASSTLKE
ncbi:MAG: trigger factor [Dehalococcoidia bacterium]